MLYGRHMMIELSKYFFTASLILFWHKLPTIESSVNLAFKKNTSQSSDLGGYPSSNAVDGQNKYCSSKGFAHTNFSEFEWWQVDLGEACEIKTIQIFYRTNFLNRLDGYSINIKNSLNSVDTWQCYKDDTVAAPINSTQYHICRRLGRYVVFSRGKNVPDYNGDKVVINLCELEVYGCPQSRYGDNCTLNCSIGCLNSRCDPDNGHCNCSNNKWTGQRCNEIMCRIDHYIDGDNCIPCPSGCFGSKCNQENGECLDGCKSQFYGKICNLTCSPNCNNTSCSRDNGSCIACKTGFYGKNCNITCKRNCAGNVCNQGDGNCTCNYPFKGNTCTECFDGYYGEACTACSTGCFNGTCNQNNGYCTCKESFFGNTCNKPCPVNCQNERCNETSGNCLDGCKTSFTGTTCNELENVNGESENQTKPNIGLIIGGIASSIVVVLIVGVIVLFLRRRSRKSDKSTSYENPITLSQPKTDQNMKDKQERKLEKTDTFKENVVSMGDSNDYCNFTDVYVNLTSTEVPVSELSSIIKKKTAEKEFESEYEKLPNGSKHPTTVGKRSENKIKNRFLTTFPYDHSRIVLKPIFAQQTSDYINANYIDGVEVNRAYIATQGPKSNTLFDFWKMVWQERSGKIVMLTNLIEDEKPKCEKYWPDVGQARDFGYLKVMTESEKEFAYFFERSLQLTMKKTKETRKILQFHFNMWPDHGTPDPVQLMLFHRKVKEAKNDLPGPPVVHCAAGIGRTGTFIALDTLNEYGEKTGKVDIFEYVIRMRKDRMNMIQTLDQYDVLHEALLESFQYTGRSLTRTKFSEVCSELDKKKPKKQTHVYKEFQNLSCLRPVYGIESYDSALDKENRRKSRNKNILAVEKYRPYLMSQHSSRTNFINAVMIPTFRKKCGYFVTHYPLENTVVDFWCMVFDHDSSTIVVLDEIHDKDNVLNWYPEDEMELTVDSFQIKKVSGPHVNGKMSETNFTITRQDDEKSVQMLMIRPWPTGRCLPPNKKDLLKLIEKTLTRQTTTSSPVTIVCSDGACGCGLFCTVSNIILNLRLEEEIDIFHTVRQLQIRRPQFISDFDEYKSCYEMVKLFLESLNIYANV